MALGFTEGKVDSNLFFKFEGERPMMLMLYVDELFLTEKRNSLKLQEENCCQVRDEELGYDALLSRHGGVEECRWNLPWTREFCSGDLEEVWDGGLQGHGHTYSIETEAIELCFIRDN